MAEPKERLTKREIRFAQGYTEHGNATRAYREAGYEFASDNAAHVAASKLLRNSKVLTYIRKLERAACDAAKITIESLAQGFSRAERADVTKILGPDGEMLPPSQWPESIRLCITRIEVDELTEFQPDPSNPRRKKKVAIGTRWKVWLENKTECRKVLAQWKRMLKGDEGQASGGDQPSDGAKPGLGVLGRIAALLTPRESARSGSATPDGTLPGGTPLDPQPGAADTSVPKPG
jgi:phage terminase small subunit